MRRNNHIENCSKPLRRKHRHFLSHKKGGLNEQMYIQITVGGGHQEEMTAG